MKTWDDIEKFDDIILEEERRIIQDTEKEHGVRCPYLNKKGKIFYYCSRGILNEDEKPSFSNPIYQQHISALEMQLFCTNRFNECCFLNEHEGCFLKEK